MLNLCLCGCGSGCKRLYVHGHNTSKIHKEKIVKYCECNCGQICNNRFVSGHNSREMNTGRKFVYTEEQKLLWLNICQCGCGQKCKKRFLNGHYLGRENNVSWNKGKTKETDLRIMKISKTKQGKLLSNAHKMSLSVSHLGKRPSTFVGKKFLYLQQDSAIIKMRSNWEVLYAEYLDFLHIKWLYEFKKFKLSDGHCYWPDFFSS